MTTQHSYRSCSLSVCSASTCSLSSLHSKRGSICTLQRGSICALLLLVLLLSSCSSELLKVHSDYLNQENLASYHVGTPDPCLYAPPMGQRLIVSWIVPKAYVDYPDLHLQLHIRFRNNQEQQVIVPIQTRSGDYFFRLVDEQYIATGGIATYKVELLSETCCLDRWTHALWAEWIPLDQLQKKGDHSADPIDTTQLPYRVEELDTDF